jgi:hypothetical protein
VATVHNESPDLLAVLVAMVRTVRDLATGATPSLRVVRMVRALGRTVHDDAESSSSPCRT